MYVCIYICTYPHTYSQSAHELLSGKVARETRSREEIGKRDAFSAAKCGPSLRLTKASQERPCGLAHGHMAMTLLNNLDSPIEFLGHNAELVVYPNRSAQLWGKEAVQLRLREDPRMMHCTAAAFVRAPCARHRISESSAAEGQHWTLQSSKQRAWKGRGSRKLRRCNVRKLVQDEAKKKRSKAAVQSLTLAGFLFVLLPLISLAVLALVAPEGGPVILLASGCYGWLGLWAGMWGPKNTLSDHSFGCRGRAAVDAAGLLGLVAVVWMSQRHAAAG